MENGGNDVEGIMVLQAYGVTAERSANLSYINDPFEALTGEGKCSRYSVRYLES